MKSFVGFLILLLSFMSVAQGKDFLYCSPQEVRAIRIAEYRSQLAIIDLIGHTKAYREQLPLLSTDTLKGGFSLNARLIRAEKILRCARSKIDKFSYKCMNFHNIATAQTYPIIGREVTLGSKFFERDQRYSMDTLVHEATHKCGTTDMAFFDVEAPEDKFIIPWELIADTYSFWVQHGFCIPEQTCKPKPPTWKTSESRQSHTQSQ